MTSRVKTILIVDEDHATRERLSGMLGSRYRVLNAASGEAAVGLLMKEQAEIVLLDVCLPGVSGLDALRILRENYPLTEVIMISARGDVELAVQAMKQGAYHYVTKDVEDEALLSLVQHAGDRLDLNRRVLSLSDQIADADRDFVIGPSSAMQAVAAMVRKVARLPATVLILGESGTGKELLARKIHRESERPDGPFVTVNLAAIPRDLVESTLFGHEKGAFTGAVRQQIGKFELASGGTLFLDEIGDLRLDLQGKLLRAIQEGEIERVGGRKAIGTDFRLIAATNVDLEKAVKDGRFRDDLYYRLNVIPIRLPPLRERREEIPDLVRFFVQRYRARFRKQVEGVSPEAMEMLAAYWWPGNVRELENMVERLVALSDREWIGEDDLPLEYQLTRDEPGDEGDEGRLQRAVTTFERNAIVKALERHDWNVTATARYLGLPLSTLKSKMERLDIRAIAKRLRGDTV